MENWKKINEFFLNKLFFLFFEYVIKVKFTLLISHIEQRVDLINCN